MLAVKKVRRIIRIARDVGRESRQRRKRCLAQLPAVTHQIINSPATRSARTGTDRHWRPSGEIEIAVMLIRLAVSPRLRRLALLWPVVSGTMKLRFRGQALAAPARVCTRLREADINRPARDFPKRKFLEHRAVNPLTGMPLPARRILFLFEALPAPIFEAPVALLLVSSGFDELGKLTVRYRQRIDAEGRDIDNGLPKLIVPAKVNLVEIRAQARLPRAYLDRLAARRRLERIA